MTQIHHPVKASAPFRVACLLILGFSSGLPLALTGSTLQAWLTTEGVDIKTIGLYAMVGSPYTYKFLWAPLLDRFHPKLLDLRRGWIVWMQLLCAGLVAGMSLMDAQHLGLVALLALSIAFCSATQDMAIDAYRTELLAANERGLGAAGYVTGYRIGMLVSGGLVLILAGEWLGWQGTFLFMSGLLVLCAMATLFCPKAGRQSDDAPQFAPLSLMFIITQSSKDFFSKPMAIWLLGLILLYKLGDAFAGSLTTAFLLKGLGFSLTEVGAINKTVSLIATISGAFLGGYILKRIGLYAALMGFGALQALSNLGFWGLSVTEPNVSTMAAAIFVENLCGGMGTAAFVALLTGLCNKQFSATQYALLSSFASVGRVYLSAPAGYAVAAWGWSVFFLGSVVIAIPGLIALYCLKNAVQNTETTDAPKPE